MIRFCSPLIPDMNLVHEYLKPSFKAGYLSNFGQAYHKLCERLHSYLNISNDKEIVLVSSGHMALQAAYYVFGVKTPAITDYTFRSTLIASFEYPCVIDCDENGFLDLNKIDAYCDAAILVCPLSRIPDLKYYEDEVKKVHRTLIIDGAATFGTPNIYNYGDCFCLSFHATKTFPIGECGAIICSKDIARKIKQYINFGFDEHKNPVMNGTNGKVSEYTCAIGLALLDQIKMDDGPIQKRIRNAKIYSERLTNFTLPTFSEQTIYQTFPIYTNSKEQADKVRQTLKKNDIEYLQYYKPLTYLENSNTLYETNICLPCHQDVSEEQIEHICDLVLGCFDEK